MDSERNELMKINKRFIGYVVVLLVLAWQSVAATDDTDILPINVLENATASAVAWSPDGTQLAVGDATGITLYTPDLEFIRHMEQPTEQMKALVWSPDGQWIAASGGNDLGRFDRTVPREKKVYIWQPKTGTLLTIFDDHEFYVPSLAWSPDSKLIASGSWDRTIRIWNVAGGVEYIFLSPKYPDPSLSYSREVMSISWSSDNRLAAIIGTVGLFVWDNFDEKPTLLVKIGPRDPPYPNFVLWSPDNNTIATGRGIYEVETKKESYFVNCPSGGDVAGRLAWSPDSKLLATINLKKMYICDPFSDIVLGTFEGRMSDQEVNFGYQNSLSWHPDGNLLAGAAGDGWVRIWDVSSFVTHKTDR